MMTDVLDENGHLGVESFIFGGKVFQLGQLPFDDVMFFDCFQNIAVGVLHFLANGGVERLLFDGGVNRQCLDDV